jgi:hypothetical protein
MTYYNHSLHKLQFRVRAQKGHCCNVWSNSAKERISPALEDTNNATLSATAHTTNYFFFFGATAPIWALAYLHETLRFTSVFYILDSR